MSSGSIMAGWEAAIAAGELRFPRCDACGFWNWYPLPRCRSCGSDEQSWTEVSPNGTLYSWTRVHRAFARERVADIPYVTGIVDITDAPGVRLVCLQRAEEKSPQIGDSVRLFPEEMPGGGRWLFGAICAP